MSETIKIGLVSPSEVDEALLITDQFLSAEHEPMVGLRGSLHSIRQYNSTQLVGNPQNPQGITHTYVGLDSTHDGTSRLMSVTKSITVGSKDVDLRINTLDIKYRCFMAEQKIGNIYDNNFATHANPSTNDLKFERLDPKDNDWIMFKELLSSCVEVEYPPARDLQPRLTRMKESLHASFTRAVQ